MSTSRCKLALVLAVMILPLVAPPGPVAAFHGTPKVTLDSVRLVSSSEPACPASLVVLGVDFGLFPDLVFTVHAEGRFDLHLSLYDSIVAPALFLEWRAEDIALPPGHYIWDPPYEVRIPPEVEDGLVVATIFDDAGGATDCLDYFYRVPSLPGTAYAIPTRSQWQPAHDAGTLALSTAEPPPPLPSGWQERTILTQRIEQGPTPGAAVNLLVVDGRSSPTASGTYDITVSVAGQTLPTVGVYTGGLVTQPAHAELLTIPSVPGQTLAVRLAYRYDPSQVVCAATVGGGCLARLPLGVGSVGWLTAGGVGAVMIVEIEASPPGVRQTFSIPIAGQAAAALP